MLPFAVGANDADRRAPPGRLAQLHVEPDHRVEAEILEQLPDPGERVAREARAAVVERRQHAHAELVADALGEQADRLEQLLHAVDREVARLERDDHLARGPQRVEGEQAHARRAIDQHVVEAVGQLGERGGEPFGARLDALAGEPLLERREHDARGRERELRRHLDDHALEPRRAVRIRQHLEEVLVDASRGRFRARASSGPVDRDRPPARGRRPPRGSRRGSPWWWSSRSRPSGSRSR